MVAPGAKGSFPCNTEDATKLTSIIPLSNPHTRTTGFQGTRIHMAKPPGTKSGSQLPPLYCGSEDTKAAKISRNRNKRVLPTDVSGSKFDRLLNAVVTSFDHCKIWR